MSLLSRYISGEYEAVWDEINGYGDLSPDTPRYKEVSEVVEETMRRVRKNIEILYKKLLDIDYRFVEPDRAWMPVDSDITEDIAELENMCGGLPLSLQYWFKLVGGVDFRGSHPTICGFHMSLGDNYFYPDFRPHPNTSDFVYSSDPLYMYNIEDAFASSEEIPMLIDEGEIEPDEAEWIQLPDELHKGNISGATYWFDLPSKQADTTFHWHPTIPFVQYLRITFAWGGFPGFYFYRKDKSQSWRIEPGIESNYPSDIPISDIKHLADGLLPI